MSPQLCPQPMCPGQLTSVALDGGKATFRRCNYCDYSSVMENQERTCKDRRREDAVDIFLPAYEDMNIGSLESDDWYGDSTSTTIDDTIANLTNKSNTYGGVLQRNPSTLAASDVGNKCARSNSQCTTAEDLKRRVTHCKPPATPGNALKDPSCEEIKEMLELVVCPNCGSPNTGTVEGGIRPEELNIRYCKNCDKCFGVDDSMDKEDFRKLFEAQGISFKSSARCKRCGNDDLEMFVLSEIDEATGQPMIECKECHLKMPLEVIQEDDEGMVEDDGWVLPDSLSDDDDTDVASLDSGIGFDRASLNEATVEHDHPPLRCDVCNHAEDGMFEKKRVNGRVTSAKCLSCYGVQNVVPPMLCPVCRNSKDFETHYGNDGSLVYAICRNCENLLDSERNNKPVAADDVFVTSPESTRRWRKKQPVRRRIISINEVCVGDHVTLHKDYVIWHHAIVVSVRPRDGKLTVVHYTGGLKKKQGHFSAVREEDLELDFLKDHVYVCDYGLDCHPPEEVVARARSRVGEHRYNPFAQNCEHFAHWCKTGDAQSNQVKAFCRRLLKACGSAAGAGVREGVVTACRGLIEGLPVKQVFRVGLQGGLERVQGVAGGAGLATALKGGAVVFDVFLNLALEAGLFAYCAIKSRRKYKSGEITKGEFYREVCQAGCECAGGFFGATGGGFLGQLAIPVPFLGSLIGCTLGTLIGRFLGSIIGKQIADRIFDPV